MMSHASMVVVVVAAMVLAPLVGAATLAPRHHAGPLGMGPMIGHESSTRGLNARRDRDAVPSFEEEHEAWVDLVIGQTITSTIPPLDTDGTTKLTNLVDPVTGVATHWFKVFVKAVASWSPTILSEFPYHGASTHGTTFALGATHHVAAKGGTIEQQVIAAFWGTCHDFGYKQAALEQGFDVLTNLALSKESQKDGLVKLGDNHEKYSIKLAEELISKLTDSDLKTLLDSTESHILGRMLIAQTKMGPPGDAAQDEVFNCHMKTGGHGHLCGYKDDYGTREAGKAYANAMGLTFAEAGENGDFYYMYQPGFICFAMNVFHEFFGYGGPEVNINPPGAAQVNTDERPLIADKTAATEKQYWDRLAFFASKQGGFMMFCNGNFCADKGGKVKTKPANDEFAANLEKVAFLSGKTTERKEHMAAFTAEEVLAQYASEIAPQARYGSGVPFTSATLTQYIGAEFTKLCAFDGAVNAWKST